MLSPFRVKIVKHLYPRPWDLLCYTAAWSMLQHTTRGFHFPKFAPITLQNNFHPHQPFTNGNQQFLAVKTILFVLNNIYMYLFIQWVKNLLIFMFTVASIHSLEIILSPSTHFLLLLLLDHCQSLFGWSCLSSLCLHGLGHILLTSFPLGLPLELRN